MLKVIWLNDVLYFVEKLQCFQYEPVCRASSSPACVTGRVLQVSLDFN